MEFSLSSYVLAGLLTKDLPDPGLAAQTRLMAAMAGRNPVVPILVATAVREGHVGPAPTAPAPAAPLPGGAASEATTPAKVQVPGLPDDPEEATEVLERRGLVAATAKVASGEPRGGVIGCEPEAGTVVPAGSTVTILVSAGLEVPDVVGKECEEAEAILRIAGFESIEIVESDKAGAETVVSRQKPKAGRYVDSDSIVRLHVFRPRRRLSAARSSEES
ncbi:MAG TPA: PASTA domain-containing protein [Solirubrobacterales bacterium]|nr:PASTA domain-containing protein [Solirubrobacterales bacterium]